MNETLEVPQPIGTRWWARVPLGLLAIAALVLLDTGLPPLPATAWTTIKHNPRGELRETLLLATWLVLILTCLTLWRSVLMPERHEAPPIDLVVPPRPRPDTWSTRTYVPPSRELLAIFATPRRTTGSAEPDPQRTTAAALVEPPVNLPAPTVEDEPTGPLLRVFGRLRLDGGEHELLRQHPTRGLIAYLILKRGAATLDELLEALWPDQPAGLARQRLWKAKQQAADVVGEALQRRNGRYHLDRTQIHIDTDEIDRLLSGEPDIRRLEGALELMQGQPLADIDYPWADNERRRLQGLHAETLARAGGMRLGAGDVAGALEATERLVELYPLNERGWRLAMEVDAALGQREAILDRYEELTRKLDARLGLRPSAETRETYHRLLGQDTRIEQPSRRTAGDLETDLTTVVQRFSPRSAESREPEGPRDST